MRSWNQALALAPMVLGVVACSGTEANNDDAGARADSGQVIADAGQTVRDAGVANDASIADAGFLDAAVRDGGTPDAGAPDSGPPTCAYPASPVEPMALNEVISPYSWATAIDGASQRIPLDLVKVHCNDDPNIEWSPFDVLLFVSIPAW